MFKRKPRDPRLAELETENEELKLKIETLKREIAELREMNIELKQSLDEAMRSSRPQPAAPPRLPKSLPPPLPPSLRRGPSKSQAASAAADSREDRELQRELSEADERMNRMMQQLSETRRQLADVQSRLTVNEQVTAVTQRRQLLQEGLYENLPAQSVYEQLRFDPAQENDYTKLQTHADVLRTQYSNLVTELDAHQVAVHMYQRNALTPKDLQSIQALRDHAIEATETLLNIILEQPDAVYLSFLDVLKHIGQQHIYQRLVEGRFTEADASSSHTSVIRQHYVFLLETLDVKWSGLVSQLYSDHVVSAEERDDISAEMTSFRANEKLLSVLSRKSPQQFQLFLDALDNSGQQNVRNVITNPPEAVLSRKSPQQFQLFLDALDNSAQRHVRTVITDRPEAQLVQTLPDGLPVLGVTSLANEIFLLRQKPRDTVEVYDVITYRLLGCLTVPNIRSVTDMTSCEHFLFLYISDFIGECIHRLDVHGNATRWPVNDKPFRLSVNANHNLMVTCANVRKIKEFTSHGDIVREVLLPDDVIHPWHAIQLTSGQFIVCHGHDDDPIHRVCKISADGHHILLSHGGRWGSATDHYNVPAHLAVIDDDLVFVVDFINRRVKLLSPTLNYTREVVSPHQLKWQPKRVYLDVQRRRLYVADNEWKDDRYTAGRVVVFSV